MIMKTGWQGLGNTRPSGPAGRSRHQGGL